MENHFAKVERYLEELNYKPSLISEEKNLFILNRASNGINKLVISCSYPILIMEQFIAEIKTHELEIFRNLLKKNRDMIHGAFALDESGFNLIFRDTLQLKNLDLNELQGSINSLELLMMEYREYIEQITRK
jgi:hypothetical protein